MSACREANIVDETAQVGDAPAVEAVIPVSRGRALSRAVVWMVPAAIGAAITAVVYPNLGFASPSGVNRLVAYSAAVVTLPAPIGALVCGFRSIRYLLLAAWPQRVCVHASARELVFHLGPFNTRRFDAASIATRYPFELGDDEGDGGFEAYLPEAHQFANLLPRLTHPMDKRSLRQTILDFCTGDEASIAGLMGPVVRQWRSNNAQSGGESGAKHVN